MKLKRVGIVLDAFAATLAVTILTVPAAAAPVSPAMFHGTVTVGGQPTSGGIEIQARINGVNYAFSTATGDGKPVTASDGTYGRGDPFQVLADDTATADKGGGVVGMWC